MFFIPINTDAPLYHYPIATIALIVANVFCFAITGFAWQEDRLLPWVLEYGNGINPLEWLSSAFAHAGFMHLFGNMVFLWSFGLIVEGKLGWWRFAALYLFIAAADGAAVDVLTLHRVDGGCLGASGAIYGLMTISLVWAPKNELHVVGFIILPFMFLRAVRFFSFDVAVMLFSLFFVGLNLLEFLIAPGMSTPGLHLVGGIIGFPLGVLLLKKGWVDCENWDLFAVMSGKYGQYAHKDWSIGAHGNPDYYLKEIPVPEAAEEQLSGTQARAKRRKLLLKQVNELIDAGDHLSAAEQLMTLRMDHSDLYPNADRTRKLAMGLLQAEAWDEAEIWLQEFIDKFPEDNAWARIRMAQLMVTQLGRPDAALQLLQDLPTEELDKPLQGLAKKVARTAKDQIRSGVKDREPEW